MQTDLMGERSGMSIMDGEEYCQIETCALRDLLG